MILPRDETTEMPGVAYECAMCGFRTTDPKVAEKHVKDANRHIRNKWWKHEIKVLKD